MAARLPHVIGEVNPSGGEQTPAVVSSGPGALAVGQRPTGQPATRLLAQRWPGVPNLGDVTTTNWNTVPPVDVITAGWPCQDTSHAGKRTGITGPRSGLWRHVIHAVRGLRPRYVFLENVAGLKTRGFDVVHTDLATLRYHTAWVCLRASAVGAAHQRDRIVILAADSDTADPVRP